MIFTLKVGPLPVENIPQIGAFAVQKRFPSSLAIGEFPLRSKSVAHINDQPLSF
jgi:hypothetical protein